MSKYKKRNKDKNKGIRTRVGEKKGNIGFTSERNTHIFYHDNSNNERSAYGQSGTSRLIIKVKRLPSKNTFHSETARGRRRDKARIRAV